MKRTLSLTLSSVLLASRALGDATSSTETTTGDFDDLSGYALVAEARSGSNGNDDLPWLDFDLIDQDWNGDGGYITWDPTLTNGFHTGTVSVDLVADLSAGTASFTIISGQGYSYTAYYSGLSGTIKNVKIRAAVETVGYSGWNGPLVNFYKDGTCTDAWESDQTTPQVDTSSTSYTVAEQTLTVTPSHSDNNKVEVVGEFAFYTDETCPGPDDLFNQIFLFTN